MFACTMAAIGNGFLGIHIDSGILFITLATGLPLFQLFLCFTLITKVLVRAAQHDYYLCIHCGYPLEGLGDDGICPECGNAYDIVSTRGLWMNECSQSSLFRVQRSVATLRGHPSPPIRDRTMSGECLPSVPPYMYRWMRRLWLVLLPAMCAMLFYISYVIPHRAYTTTTSGTTRLSLIELLFIFGVYFLVIFGSYFILTTSLLVRVQRHEHAICIHCGNPLVGLDETGKCAKCSAVYDLNATRQLWERMCKQSLLLQARRACKALFGFGSSG